MLTEQQDTVGYLAILHASDNTTQSLEAFQSFPRKPIITDCHLSPVTSKPDLASSPCFRWAAGDCDNSYGGIPTDCEGYVQANETDTVFEFTNYAKQPDGVTKGVSITMRLSQTTPWDNTGLGPMGLTEKVPYLGLYWYVHSLGTQTEYEYKTFNITESGERITTNFLTGIALSHQEKNWGDTFPKAWIWSEGRSEDNTIHFALAGGPKKIPLTPFEPVLWLVGYRSPRVGSWDFAPQHLVNTFEPSIDGCNGHFVLTISGILRKLVVDVKANEGSFNNGGCLFGPNENGFSPMAQESFVATAKVDAYERRGLKWELVDSNVFTMASLEFGGQYTCKSCSE